MDDNVLRIWRQLATRGLTPLRRLRRRLAVVRRSPYDNIYHCCTQKTASQWFKAIFSDPIVYRYTGLDVYTFVRLVEQDVQMSGPVPYAYFKRPLPRRAIGTTLYIGYLAYITISKPEKYKTFFIVRDPRDIVVSWYFSARYSHSPIGLIPKFRRDLENLNLKEGLKYSIDVLQETGLFCVQRSWARVPKNDEKIKIFRYEDFAQDNCSFLKRLFAYLDIVIPEDELKALYERHNFAKYAGGRRQGMEDSRSHYRKGQPGDWQNYCDASTRAYFRKVTGDLLEVLGYE